MIALILVVAASAQVDACYEAVHGDLVSAEAICTVSKAPDVLFDEAPASAANDLSTACKDALAAGVNAGKFGARLPAPAKQGYVREFDKKLAECRNPTPKQQVPTLKTTNPWD